MITKLELNNFKSFLSASLPFSKLTILTGLNSSGKSSVFQAMSLLATQAREFYLLGHGSFADLRCRYSDVSEDIKLAAAFRQRGSSKLTWVRAVFSDSKERPATGLSYFDSFHAIIADRFGPKVALPALKDFSPQSVGTHGEHVIQYCMNHLAYPISALRCHSKAKDFTFDYQLEAWMGEVCPGVRFRFYATPETDTGYYTVGNVKDNTIEERPTNVGFGIAYTLPIVCQLLGSEKDDIVFLENPEAHLHPLGQTRIGELIARTAKDDVQLIVETHSDHLVDGVRIAVKQGLIAPEDISILFFAKNSENITEVTPLKVLENGNMSDWPEGFFDQSMKNLSYLAEF